MDKEVVASIHISDGWFELVLLCLKVDNMPTRCLFLIAAYSCATIFLLVNPIWWASISSMLIAVFMNLNGQRPVWGQRPESKNWKNVGWPKARSRRSFDTNEMNKVWTIRWYIDTRRVPYIYNPKGHLGD